MRNRLKIPLLFGKKRSAAIPWYLAGGVDAASCVGAWQAIGAEDLAASYVNLANPGTNNLTAGATPPTWNATDGWIFDGVNTVPLNTGYNPTTGGRSMIIRFTDCADVTWKPIIGENTTDAIMAIYAQAGANVVGYYNGGGLQVAPKQLSGILGVAGQKGYRSGIEEAGSIPAWVGSSTKNIYIGGQTEANRVVVKIQAVAIYSSVLTAAQMLAITTAMNP